MKKVTINVGLNIGLSEPKGQLKKTLDLIKPIRWRLRTGEWQGVKERTFVAVIDPETPSGAIPQWCIELGQSAIALKVDDHGFMVHNPNSVESFEFDAEFFNDFVEEKGDKMN